MKSETIDKILIISIAVLFVIIISLLIISIRLDSKDISEHEKGYYSVSNNVYFPANGLPQCMEQKNIPNNTILVR